MAAKGKTDKVGASTEDEAPEDAEETKDFKGSEVEGKKDADTPITCEQVIKQLRKDKYPI